MRKSVKYVLVDGLNLIINEWLLFSATNNLSYTLLNHLFTILKWTYLKIIASVFFET